MPKLLENNISTNSVLALWKTTESYHKIRECGLLSDEEYKEIEKNSHEKRRIEMACIRLLLKQLLPDNPTVAYTERRKPFIKGNNSYLSITHSHELCGIYINKENPVGIDIEFYGKNYSRGKKILNIQHKFLSKNEFFAVNSLPELYIIWAAKEVVYKLLDKEGISFSEDIELTPFIGKNSSGEIQVIYLPDNKTFKMKFEHILDEYILVYSL